MVSICVATYNSEKFIANTLESIRKQTYRDFEVIIVDDHSTDNTVNIILDYCLKDTRFKLYLNCTSKSKSYYDAHNKSYEYANGEYLIRIDNDDIYELDFISTIVKHMNDETLDACCLSQDFYLYNDPLIIKHPDPPKSDNYYKNIESFNIEPILYSYKVSHFSNKYYYCFWQNNHTCIRKNYLKANPHLKYMSFCAGDSTFWANVFASGAKAKKLREFKTHKLITGKNAFNIPDFHNISNFVKCYSAKLYMTYFKEKYNFPNINQELIKLGTIQENTYNYFKNILETNKEED